MRQFFTTLSLLFAVSAFSNILTPEEALQRALADQSGPSRISGQHQSELIKTIDQKDGTPAAYLFTDSKTGWMIVSASDATSALLGYGNNFNPAVAMPPQMEWWLSQYATRIHVADSLAQTAPSAKRLYKRENTARSIKRAQWAPIEPLMSTKWDQSDPYNLYSPEVNGEKTPTGCVATAMCQVMKHHNYPESGSGTGYARAGNQQLTLDLNLPIAWDDMIDCYYPWEQNYTQQQAEAVASLMQMAGYACRMNYAPDGSSAGFLDATRGFVSNFSYAISSYMYHRDYYELDEWEDMLYEELANDRPVFYGGQSPYGGHAFVCDGYEGNGYFHFNWGWGGWFDGMFLIDALDPEGQGIGGFDGGYNTDQVAVMGVTPPTGNETKPVAQLFIEQPPVLTISDNSRFEFNGGWFNDSCWEETFLIAFEIKNIATGEIWHTDSFQSTLQCYYGYTSLYSYANGLDCPDGQYTVQVVTQADGEQEWLPALHPYWMDAAVRVDRTDGQWISLQALPLVVESAVMEEVPSIGNVAECQLTVQNPGSFPASDTYAAYLVREEDGWMFIVADTDPADYLTVSLDAHQSETFTMPFTFRIADYDLFEYDTDLFMVIADPNTWEIDYNLGIVQIASPTVEPESIVLNKTEATIDKGDYVTLMADINPADATDLTVTWSTSDPGVATVDAGVVTGIAGGMCVISATTVNGLQATCEISVREMATQISLWETELHLGTGESYQLMVDFYPETTTERHLDWSSSDPSVATVDDGLVTMVAAGTAIITATYATGITATCTVYGMTGVDSIFSEGAGCDIYTVTGVLVRRNATGDDLKLMTPGIYIVHTGSKTFKVHLP